MRYFHSLNFELLFRCLSLVVYSYALIIAVVEVSIFYALLPALLYLVISGVSLSLPEEYFVTKVLGKSRRAQLRSFDLETDESFAESYPCIAYQAAALDSTEDIISAVKLCWRKGCKFVHLDVRITSDNVAVVGCLENAVFDPNTRIRAIEESSFFDLSTSLLSAEDSRTMDEPTTLEDVVKLCTVKNFRLMINVIHSSYYRSVDSTVDIILNLYEKYSLLFEQCIIASSNPWFLYKIRRRNKNIVVALQWQSMSDSSATTISWLKKAPCGPMMQRCLLGTTDEIGLFMLRNFLYMMIGISAVILPKHLITPGIVEYWESKHVRCIAAVVNLSSEKWYYERALGITYLTETVTQLPRSNY